MRTGRPRDTTRKGPQYLLRPEIAAIVARSIQRGVLKFWQAESYDQWVRDDAERERLAAYIERNPVKASLVDSVEKYRWSSAGKSVETSLDAADTSVRATQASLIARFS